MFKGPFRFDQEERTKKSILDLEWISENVQNVTHLILRDYHRHGMPETRFQNAFSIFLFSQNITSVDFDACYDADNDGIINRIIINLLSANCPNLKILNIKFGYKLYDDIQDLRNSLPDILRINSLEKLSFLHLRTEDDSFGIDYKENSTIKELRFEESALSGETLIHIATKSLHLEKLYVEGQTRDVYDWFLNIEFNEMVEILNILSVYGTIKDLQILNCVYDNIDDTVEDIENFFRSNLVPLIQSKFSMIAT